MIVILGGSSSLASKLLPALAKKDRILCFYNKNKPNVKKKNIEYIKLNFENFKLLELVKKNFLKKIKNQKISLINFASIKIDKLSLFINDQELNKTLNINFISFFKIIKFILPNMIEKRWGRVISISSTGGMRGDKGTFLYTTSKHASLGMIKSMSKEYGKYNITFNTINLGNFNYGLFTKLSKNKKQKLLSSVPSNKTGDIENIQNAINFIIKSNYVNNSEISIDGGM
jgi:NAD(P)-dependent dehydrogenase (short-subunit alcohol dehydrogenase family)|tara:strand:+ start:270 stop:956 length:687 start_codon:yes stop_codon:yes gene_type:complete